MPGPWIGAMDMTIDDFRNAALSMPMATEESHMSHPDFRVKGKIFATIYSMEESLGMVKLTPDQQSEFIQAKPKMFVPVKGSWGVKGATLVRLDAASEGAVLQSIVAAWRNTAPKNMVKEFDGQSV